MSATKLKRWIIFAGYTAENSEGDYVKANDVRDILQRWHDCYMGKMVSPGVVTQCPHEETRRFLASFRDQPFRPPDIE